MKIIIGGSRRLPSLGLNYYKDWLNDKEIYKILEDCIKLSNFNITEVVSGRCWGIDQLGEKWAKNNNISIIEKPADWSLGKKAGYVRNREMAKIADGLICIYAKNSKGSEHMIKTMKELDKPIYEKQI